VAAAAAAAAVKPTVERHGAFRACVSKYSDATEKETGKDTGKERQSEGRGGGGGGGESARKTGRVRDWQRWARMCVLVEIDG